MTRSGVGKALAAGIAASGLLQLAACGTPASGERMSLSATSNASSAVGTKWDHTLAIGRVGGGSDTSPVGLSEVSNPAIGKALGASLRSLGYLADDPAKATLLVDASLYDLDRPVVAFDPVLLVVPINLEVTVKVHYVVRRVAGGAPLFDDLVATTGSATAGDAITPFGRVTRANEAAMRLNIAAFLERLQTGSK